MNNRLRISLVLMLVSMVLLAAFQAWWLYKSYREEEETLGIRTSMLFRETLYGMQAIKLSLDSNFQFRFPSRTNMVGVVNKLSAKMVDTTITSELPPDEGPGPGRAKLIVSMDRSDLRVSRDSPVRSFVRYSPTRYPSTKKNI